MNNFQEKNCTTVNFLKNRRMIISTAVGSLGIVLLIVGVFCTNNNPINDQNEKNTVVDADGNVYTTVIIGTQEWMVENLRTTRFNDGTDIPLVTDDSAWSNLHTPGYCFYNNNTDAIEQEKWGALYNWYTVNTGKLAPAGWHVPSDSDWIILSDYLGGENVAGGKMKEEGTENWLTPNTNATNSSGFRALPGGYRDEGLFVFLNEFGTWWCATEYDEHFAYYRTLTYNYTRLARNSYYKDDGFSVRLVRD